MTPEKGSPKERWWLSLGALRADRKTATAFLMGRRSWHGQAMGLIGEDASIILGPAHGPMDAKARRALAKRLAEIPLALSRPFAEACRDALAVVA